MVNNSLQKELHEEYDAPFSYETGRQHMYEKWRDLLRFYSFKVGDLILGPLKERNMSKEEIEKQNVPKSDIVDEKGEMFPQKTEVLGLHDSLSAVADGTSAQMETRAKEIRVGFQKLRTWFKNELMLRNIWKTMIEGIDKFPRINIPDMSLFVEKDEENL